MAATESNWDDMKRDFDETRQWLNDEIRAQTGLRNRVT
jgi:hypothetical protein